MNVTNITNVMNVTIMIIWYEQLKPEIITFVLDGYLHHLNVVNVTNVMNVTVEKEKNTQKTIHMLESCSLMMWSLKSWPLECCECNECSEYNSYKRKKSPEDYSHVRILFINEVGTEILTSWM